MNQPTTTPAQPAKEIRYSAETRDFELLLDNVTVGWARSYFEGEQKLDALVYDILTHRAEQAPAEEPCAWCGGDGCKSAMQAAFCADCVQAMLRGEDGARKDMHRPVAAPEAAGAEAEALAEQLVGELNQIDGQQVAAAAEGRTELAYTLALAYADTSDRIRALGYDIGPSDPAACIGESPLCLYDVVTQLPLRQAAAETARAAA